MKKDEFEIAMNLTGGYNKKAADLYITELYKIIKEQQDDVNQLKQDKLILEQKLKESTTTYSELWNKHEEQEQSVKEREEAIEARQKTFDAQEEKIQEQAAEIQSQEGKIHNLEAEIKTQKGTIQNLAAEINNHKETIQSLKMEVQSQAESLGNREQIIREQEEAIKTQEIHMEIPKSSSCAETELQEARDMVATLKEFLESQKDIISSQKHMIDTLASGGGAKACAKPESVIAKKLKKVQRRMRI